MSRLALLFIVPLLACDDGSTLSCGEGTTKEGGECVPADTPDARLLLDATVPPDGPLPDGPLPDGPLPDGPLPDLPIPDAAPDVAPDMAPDAASPCLQQQDVTGDWSGQWSGTLSGNSPIVGGEFVYQTAGLLAFEIFCEDDKLLIRGGLDGIAENLYPFEAMLAGEYDAESGRVVMQMVEGVVHINFQGFMIDVQFEGTLTGEVVGERIDQGTWEGRSTLPEGAEGDGVWQAAKQQ